MFSFFRKKPPPADTPATPSAEPGPAPGSEQVSSRPRTAMEWLNADVGELLFGKKPAAAPAPVPAPEPAPEPEPAPASRAAPAPPTPSPPPVPPPASLSPPPAAASSAAAAPATVAPVAAVPEPEPEPESEREDRSDWLAKLRTGLRKTGLPPYSLGYVYLPALVAIVVTSTLLAPVGARVAHALPVARLRHAFAAMLFVLGAYMWWKAYHLYGA